MKIDTEYLKGLLNAFQASDTPFTDIRKLAAMGFDFEDDRFIFHIQLMEDQGLIEEARGGDLGYVFGGMGDIHWSCKDIRLTADGHNFIDALDKSEVWEIIKKDFKEESLGTLLKVVGSLAEKLAQNKITKILNL